MISAESAIRRIEPGEFALFQRLVSDQAGIHLGDSKVALVQSRLAKRLQYLGLDTYTAYFELISSGSAADELQMAIDLLTTNETHFFREPSHFDFFRDHVLRGARPAQSVRVWSAACSSGEEAYSAAMVLADRLGPGGWEVVGSDISTRVLEQASRGQYPMERAAEIPRHYLSKFCLKGVGRQAGTFAVAPELSAQVRFMQINLNERLPAIGEFDVVFLRNVMIYFNLPTKQRVVSSIVPRLKPRGYLFVGHSETLNGVSEALEPVLPAVYRLR